MSRENYSTGSKWEPLIGYSRAVKVGKAHGEFFGDIRPATAMVQVAALISPEILVEIEADAYVGK